MKAQPQASPPKNPPFAGMHPLLHKGGCRSGPNHSRSPEGEAVHKRALLGSVAFLIKALAR